jgi:hypothetical protein
MCLQADLKDLRAQIVTQNGAVGNP